MKRFYTTMVMAALLALAVAYILIVEQKIKPENEKIAKNNLKIARLSKEDITSITIKRNDGEVVLSKFGLDKWQIKKPLEVEASNEEVNRMVDTFVDASMEDKQQPNQPKDLAPFGLNPAKVTVTITAAADKIAKDAKNAKDAKPGKEPAQAQAQVLLLGDNVPVGSGFFGKFGDKPDVYVMPGNLLNAFDKGLKDLRKKKIADFPLANIQELAWQYKGSNLKFYRDAESQSWNMSKPYNTDASDTEVTELLTELTQLEAEDFVSENPADHAQYGVGEAQSNRVEVTVKDGATSKLVTLLFNDPSGSKDSVTKESSKPAQDSKKSKKGKKGKDSKNSKNAQAAADAKETNETKDPKDAAAKDNPLKDKLYCRILGQNTVFRVKNALEKRLLKASNDFREKKVFNFSKDSVQKIELAQGKQKITLNKSSAGNWEIVKQEGLAANSKIDQAKVDEIFTHLKDINALKFVDDAKVIKAALSNEQKISVSLFNEQVVGKPKNLGEFKVFPLETAQKGKKPLIVSALLPNLPVVFAEIKEDSNVDLGISSLLSKPPTPPAPKAEAHGKEVKTMKKMEPTVKSKAEIKKLPASIVEKGKKYAATFHTNKGDIDISLLADKSPYTVSNFINLARNHYYDGLKFHRVIAGFMAQGGDPTGTGSGGPGYQFADEFSDAKNERGSLSMANAGPNTNGSQFFICFQPQPHLNGKHTVFGNVTKGLEVLDQIKQNDVMSSVEVFEE